MGFITLLQHQTQWIDQECILCDSNLQCNKMRSSERNSSMEAFSSRKTTSSQTKIVMVLALKYTYHLKYQKDNFSIIESTQFPSSSYDSDLINFVPKIRNLYWLKEIFLHVSKSQYFFSIWILIVLIWYLTIWYDKPLGTI